MIYAEKRYPGLLIERMASGNLRARVRKEGDKRVKVTLSVMPGDRDFPRQYHDARAGYATRRDEFARLRGTGNVSAHISKMLARAKTRGMAVSITEDEVMELLLRQDSRCAISGVRFDLTKEGLSPRRPFAPSLDRIENAIGYLRENVMITCTIVNTARSDWARDDFMSMCKAVASRG